MDPLVKKIEDLFLTRTESAIADYIIDNLDTIGLLTSRELAARVGVSDASVIRLVRKLGFPTYARFRTEMNDRIAQNYRRQSTAAAPPEPDAVPEILTNSLVKRISEQLQSNLTIAFNRLDDTTVQQIVDILLTSEHKYVAGFHTTAGCAQYMATRLVQLVPHVIPLVNADASCMESILDIGPKDCLLVYTFMKFSHINVPLMNLARQNGARIILITDKVSTPLARKADITLLTPLQDKSTYYSYAAPLTVSEILLMTLIQRGGSDGELRMHRLEALLDNIDLH